MGKIWLVGAPVSNGDQVALRNQVHPNGSVLTLVPPTPNTPRTKISSDEDT